MRPFWCAICNRYVAIPPLHRARHIITETQDKQMRALNWTIRCLPVDRMDDLKTLIVYSSVDDAVDMAKEIAKDKSYLHVELLDENHSICAQFNSVWIYYE